jgi:hypothetical protein
MPAGLRFVPEQRGDHVLAIHVPVVGTLAVGQPGKEAACPRRTGAAARLKLTPDSRICAEGSPGEWAPSASGGIAGAYTGG